MKYQYAGTAIIALIIGRDMAIAYGPKIGIIAGLAAFIAANFIWHHAQEAAINRGNRQYEDQYRNRRRESL